MDNPNSKPHFKWLTRFPKWWAITALVLALAIVAAAAALLVVRQIRRRRSPKLPECANCTIHDQRHAITNHTISTNSDQP